MDVLTQKVPSTVVEVTNTLAGTTPVNLPAGDPSIPVFACIAGSTETYIIADCTGPTAHKIYSGNLFANGGYMVFLSGTGATLAGAWSAIGQNGEITVGSTHYSQFELYSSLPWPPTPGVDTFYVSTAPPIDVSDEGSFGFPYVPVPQSAA
jgi:hypothetical protein